MSKEKTILVHLPSYRDPELIPTIKDALQQAKYPERIHFGICRQYHPDDKFDDLSEYKQDKRFKIYECLYNEAKGLPWARSIINEQLLTDEDYICQLDSHHRFAPEWDDTLIEMHGELEKKGYKPIIAGYSPLYDPFNDPAGRSMEPWQSQFICFYPHSTIFIRPGLLHGYENMNEPPMSRFLCGHFGFARSQWAKEIKHDPDIYFSGEEINLTVRSYTHGYDIFHPYKIVVWHSTMREERAGKLKWDDDAKLGVDWWGRQEKARAKIRQLFRIEDNGFDLTGYDLGTERTIADYEAYAGVNFKNKSVQKYTLDNGYPPSLSDSPWFKSFYYLVTVYRRELPEDDYSSILIAFDDKDGIGIYSKSIEGQELQDFLNNKGPIHFEETFQYNDKEPIRMVAWAYSKKRGWVERIEHKI